MSAVFQIPASIYGSEPDLEPWEVMCQFHQRQVGRLTDKEHFGEASNRGCCEMCLRLDYVICEHHWVQLKTTDGGCYECFKEQFDPARPAVASSPEAQPAGQPKSLVDLPFAGVERRQDVLDAPVRSGPPPFGGIPSSSGGRVGPGIISSGGGEGAGHPADRAPRSPVPPATPVADAQAPPATDILAKFRALAATGLLRNLAAATPSDEAPQGGE